MKNEINIPIFFFGETESTVTAAKEYARTKPSPAFFVAKKQTGGMGRKGRSFASPVGGIYMSYLFSPRVLKGEGLLGLTTAVCVAVCRSIKRACGIDTQIKWVNDIYYKGKKVCGILTQSITGESGEIENIIVGIGINFTTPENAFPEEIRDIAGSLYSEAPLVSDTDLIKAIIEGLLGVEYLCESKEYLDEYRQRSMVIGKQVRCFIGEEEFCGEAVDIDENGGLKVMTEDGIRTLSSGEVTLRLK